MRRIVTKRCVAAVLAGAVTLGSGCGGSNSETVSTDVCASGQRWTGGDEESELMHPGRDCIECHTREGEGPKYTVAGTVYAQANQADDCFGVTGVSVEVTDANKQVIQLTSNEAGNFFTTQQIAFPYTVKVLSGGKENKMVAAQGTGACGSCHTQQGANAAPGRVLAP